ncbi:uncharacterized protein [Epargyreus clarus]|uniref:uncharacterized protein n=1 Tax=Epargyreus clarus TaxID=520877 RepID=UPI003C2BA8A7
MSRTLKYGNRNNGVLANFLNYFYINQSKAKISNFVKNLKLYRSRTRRGLRLNLKNIVRNGIESIIDPLVQFGAAIRDMQTENKQIPIESEKATSSNLFKDFVKNFMSDTHGDDKENEILDYIDNYKRVIDKHLTKKDFLREKTDSNTRSETKKRKRSTTSNKYIRTTTEKSKYTSTESSSEELKSKLREKINKKHTTVKTSKKVESDESDDTSTDKDLSKVKEPFLIRIGSSDDSKSGEDYETTTTQRTKQRRYKKFTRSRATTKKPFSFIRTSKKYRKSFLSTVSHEGLSIEHFGSMVTKSHRKSNDNDTFTDNVLNASLKAVTGVTKPESTEIMDDNVSKVERISGKDELDIKKIPETEESIRDTTSRDLKEYVVTETINLKGNIFIDKPINITNKNTISLEIMNKAKNDEDSERKKSVHNIQTKYFNAENIKPTIYLRSHNFNESDVTTPNMETFNITTTKTLEDVDIITEGISMKTIDDGLENEIESIIDKLNKSTTFPAEFDNFLKEAEMNNVKSDIKDQMKADLANLISPTTENRVTDMYTDPFSELDAMDLLK